jgi:pimeloyl-ACP methyl ester carboxylesterase
MTTNNTLVGQLRGATRLAIEATRNITDLVETVHHTIGGGPDLLGRPLASTTKLLTAPTYGAIRGVTSMVSTGLDRALAALEPVLDHAGAESGPLLAVLNGVLGDYLAETHNPLAIQMRLCTGGLTLELTPEALARAFPEGGRLLVIVHGSSLDEASWLRKGHDHGAALATDLGFQPLYLRYNTGLHISQNGRAFAALLEQLVTAWPRPIEELVLLGHSMGGLVSRSACAVGEAEGHVWRQKLRAILMLGSPHHGAPLERGGNWIDTTLSLNRYSAPFARLGRLRSAGVTDLRYGNVLDEDWHGQDRFARNGDKRVALALPKGVACFAIAGSTASAPSKRMSGDGLVPVNSALGRHADGTRALAFDEDHQWIALGTSHFSLLSSQAVYEKLRAWLSTGH